MSDFIVPRLGDLANELVTEFEGVVTAITRHLGGEITVTLTPQAPGGHARSFPQQLIVVTKQGWAVPSHLEVGG